MRRRSALSPALAAAALAATASCDQAPSGPYAGPPAALAIVVQPASIVAGAHVSPAVTVAVHDSAGVVVTESRAAIRLRITTGSGTPGAHLRGVTVVSAEEGIAAFPALSIDSAGAGYTLTATSAGLGGAESDSFDVAVGPASHLAFVVQPTDAMTGFWIAPPVAVAVCDSVGNTVRGSRARITVSMEPGSGEAKLVGETAATAANGVASFPAISIDSSSESIVLRATSAGLQDATSGPFAVDLPVRAVSAGYDHTCAVSARNTLHCWGSGRDGALGSGTTADSRAPLLVGGGYASVSAGSGGTCGVTAAGAVWCWGRVTRTPTPVPVSGVLGFSAASAGSAFACGLGRSGIAYCWGENPYGQLGNGTISDSRAPVEVAGGLYFSRITAGIGEHACGVTSSGIGYCWGRNDQGQLGDGSTVSRWLPTRVSGPSWLAISPGVSRTCALAVGGEPYCWGRWWGPVPFPDHSSGYESISQACGLRGDGSLDCWQDFESGLWADYVPAGLTFTGLSVGYGHACGVTARGALYCWGDNASGQVGDGTTWYRDEPVRVRIF